MNCRIHSSLRLLQCIFLSLFVAALSSSKANNQSGMVQVLETETWDEANQAWKASGERWTTAKGQSSDSPSDLKAPEGFEFVGEWKIVVSSGDSMGWEYEFQYLRSPKRKRTWLRSLKQSDKVSEISAADRPDTIDRSKRKISSALALIRDDFNFKGFGIGVSKSVIFPRSLGVSLRLPLTTNFVSWDRYPELPNLSTSVSFMFPWTIAAFLSGSVRVEWLKWAVKHVLQFVPRLIIYCIYEVFLPIIWKIIAALSLFTIARLPPLPKAPIISISRPRYNPEISEKVGCSVSYRWSKKRGFEWRVNYWHSYLPTLVMYRKLLRMKCPPDWWQKHFGSIGLSTGYPTPSPPNFSCSAQLALSGLYFERKNGRSSHEPSVTVHNAIKTNSTQSNQLDALDADSFPSPRIAAKANAVVST